MCGLFKKYSDYLCCNFKVTCKVFDEMSSIVGLHTFQTKTSIFCFINNVIKLSKYFLAVKCIFIYNKQLRRRKFLTCIHFLFAEENHDHDLLGGFDNRPRGYPRWLPGMMKRSNVHGLTPGDTSSQDITPQPPSYFIMYHNGL